MKYQIHNIVAFAGRLDRRTIQLLLLLLTLVLFVLTGGAPETGSGCNGC